jgi:nickel-type superoxide dismutase maturation protease
VVAEESMAPTLRPGDRVRYETRAYRRAPPREGEVVILRDPESPSRWLIKRVASVDPATRTVDVRGDAESAARDSRQFGPVPFELLVGRAYCVYFPPDRRREL